MEQNRDENEHKYAGAQLLFGGMLIHEIFSHSPGSFEGFCNSEAKKN